MMEMKITVEAPDLAASILKLAEAIASGPDPALLIPDEPLPVSAYPTTPAPASPVAAPVSPAPVNPTPGPAPTTAAPMVAPSPSPTPVTNAPTAGPTSAAPGNTPAPAVPVAGAPTYTLDQISRAGASLVDAGKMQQLLELLGRYGVQAVTQLKPEQYGAFATELRALGAQI
ncbi:hypothetical protein B5G12_00325 [Faecalibacterium sp. An58]|uniref:hypothetical protein n=1 Tax=Faecalibacterium sp. An58 TaxID=1965648 RepID=UPI000B3A630D|nr:hypothetical protein [Faecalibacterium sp. An58]OUN75557.1 hypothetical protein B5G12_00325 [Faecalibacterium sp. An58]